MVYMFVPFLQKLNSLKVKMILYPVFLSAVLCKRSFSLSVGTMAFIFLFLGLGKVSHEKKCFRKKENSNTMICTDEQSESSKIIS